MRTLLTIPTIPLILCTHNLQTLKPNPRNRTAELVSNACGCVAKLPQDNRYALRLGLSCVKTTGVRFVVPCLYSSSPPAKLVLVFFCAVAHII